MAVDGSLIFDTGLDSSGFTKGLTGLKTAAVTAAAAITAAFTGAAAAAVNVGTAYTSSMSQVAATMGITTAAEEYKTLSAAAKEMGATTKFSASQAADALNYLALAGYDAEQSVSALPTVLNLAAAGGIDLAYASDMVTDSMSALGLGMNEMEGFADRLAKTSQKSNTSVAQLGEAILTVGGTAKSLSGGVNELNTMLGVIADNGVKGAEGGTALRNVILSLSAPTDTAARAMANLGVSAYDLNGNLRYLPDVFADFNTALGSLSESQKSQILSDIFNKVDLKTVNALLGTSAERFDELAGYIADCGGAAAQMAETMSDNLEGDMLALQSALEGVGIAAFEKFESPMRSAVQAVTDILGKFNDALKGDLGDKLERLGEKIENLAVKFADFSVNEGLPKLIDGLEWLCNHSAEVVTAAELFASVWIADKVVKFAGELGNITKAAGNVMPSLTNISTLMTGSVTNACITLEAKANQTMTSLVSTVKGAEAASAASFAAIAAAAAVAVGSMIAISNELNTIRNGMNSITGENQKSTDNIINMNEQWSDISNSTGLEKLSKASEFYDDLIKKREEWSVRYKKNTDELSALEGKFLKTADETARQKELQAEQASLNAEYEMIDNNLKKTGNLIDKYDDETIRKLNESKSISDRYIQQNINNAGKTSADIAAEIISSRTDVEQAAAEELSAVLSNGWKELDHKYAVGAISSEQELYAKKKALLDEYGDSSLEDHRKYYEELYGYEQDFAEESAKLEQERLDEEKKLQDEARKKQLDDLKDSYKKQLETVKGNISDTLSEYKKAMSELEGNIAGYKAKLLSVGDIFSVEEKDGTRTYTIENIKQQMEDMKKYHSYVKNLKAAGAADGL
ncbi:MAG: phage tail tape measure protein, partial [Ruminococcus sp.]|nr:phage tail tape measure protein [Ruminococcus sp.]